MARPIPYHECCRIRDALKESDRLDAMVDKYRGPGEPTMTCEEYQRLKIQQQGAWALVRYLVLDAADATSYDPPVSVDIGDAVIIVYAYQDDGDGARSMDAGWMASWNIVRPGETPAWATEPETNDDDDGDDEFAFKIGDN
jgi:hypothetical protein